MRVREFAVTARRFVSERRRAAEIAEQLLRKTPPSDCPSLVDDAELQTAGAIHHLGEIFADMVTKKPLEVPAELALSLAESVAPAPIRRSWSPKLKLTPVKTSGKPIDTSVETTRPFVTSR